MNCFKLLNNKAMQVFLFILLLLETYYLVRLIIRNFDWETNLPQFCSTFNNGTCLLDYLESKESFLKRYEDYCQHRFSVGKNRKISSCNSAGVTTRARKYRHLKFRSIQNPSNSTETSTSNESNFKILHGERILLRNDSAGWKYDDRYGNDKLPLCNCVTDDVLTKWNNNSEKIDFYLKNLQKQTNENYDDVDDDNDDDSDDIDDDDASYNLCSDGSRQPANCNARHKTAIIIPYRDRKTHLKIIVNLLHDLLKTQNLAYNIFVVEQNLPDIFNKAAVMNAGFIEVMNLYDDFDCFIFHDVDMAPLEYSNFYVCLDIPRHVGAFLATFHFQLPYKGLFGGATAFRKDQFLKFNGFSNEYYGWGGEDDDILKRVKSVNMAVNRFPSSVARYKMFPHHADPRNPGNQNKSSGFNLSPSHYPRDGLNTAKYTVESVKIMKKYTHILISLPPPPSSFMIFDRYRQQRSLFSERYLLWWGACLFVFSCSIFLILRRKKSYRGQIGMVNLRNIVKL